MSIRDDLKAYIDGELEPERAEDVRLALDADPELQEEYTQMKKIGIGIKNLAKDPQVKGSGESVNLLPNRNRSWRTALTWAGAVAATLLLVGLIAPKLMRPESAGVASAPIADSVSSEVESTAPAEDLAGNTADATADESPAPDTRFQAEYRERQVIQTAEFRIKVEDVRNSLAEAERIVEELGGYIENSELVAVGAEPHADLTLRVPAAKYEDAIGGLRKQGVVLRETISGRDVTADFERKGAALSSQLDRQRELQRALGSAESSAERSQIEAQIRQLQQDAFVGRRALDVLQQSASFGSISVSFVEKVPDTAGVTNWRSETLSSATGLLGSIGKVFGRGAIYAVVLSPVWITALLVGLWMRDRLRAATG